MRKRQLFATIQINGKYYQIHEEVSVLIADLTHQSENLRDKLRVLEAQPMGVFADRYFALKLALIKYGKHLSPCTYGVAQPKFTENPCTCGLLELLR